MRRARFRQREQNIVTERALECLGTVSVRLEVLKFETAIDSKKLEKNVDRLEKAILDEGCRRLPLSHYYRLKSLRRALVLQLSNLSREQLPVGLRNEYPSLSSPPATGSSVTMDRAELLPPLRCLPIPTRGGRLTYTLQVREGLLLSTNHDTDIDTVRRSQ